MDAYDRFHTIAAWATLQLCEAIDADPIDVIEDLSGKHISEEDGGFIIDSIEQIQEDIANAQQEKKKV